MILTKNKEGNDMDLSTVGEIVTGVGLIYVVVIIFDGIFDLIYNHAQNRKHKKTA